MPAAPPIMHRHFREAILPAPSPPPSIKETDPPRHGFRVRIQSFLRKKSLMSLFGDARTIQHESTRPSSRSSTSTSASELRTPLDSTSTREHSVHISPLRELNHYTRSPHRQSSLLFSDDPSFEESEPSFEESEPRFLPVHSVGRNVETRIGSLSLQDQPTRSGSAIARDDIASSAQSLSSHAVDQLDAEHYSEVETSISIQEDDSNSLPPSAPTEWKNINEAYLDSTVKTKEGFKLLTGLEGDNAVIVADIIDKILKSHHITDNQRKFYTAILRKLCGHSGIFPASHTLAEGLVKVGEWPKAGGAFAEVWEGRYRNRPVAIKALRVYKKDEILQVKKRFCKETVIWKRMSHPNVLTFLGVATSPFPFCIASPWMANGNVNEYLTSHPQANRYFLLRDIVDGLGYLHSLGIVHGDLKGANILMSDTYRACLADFGLTTIATDAIPGYSASTMTSGGAIRWMAPELLIPEDYGLEKSVPSRESDIYAFGIVIYEVITGVVPFVEISHPQLIVKVLRGDRPERPNPSDPAILSFTNVVWPIAEECWLEHRNERPSLSRILERLSLPG